MELVPDAISWSGMEKNPMNSTATQRSPHQASWLLPLCACAGITLITGAAAVDAADRTEGMTVSVSRPVHPVLIRNEHGPLLRVVVELADNQQTTLRSLTVSLAGTDDLADIESLGLFFTGDEDAFSSTNPVGEPQGPAATLTFCGEQPLRSGKSVFWLSCRLKHTANLLRHVAVACSKVETGAGALTPGDALSNFRHRIGMALRKHNDDGVHTYRIPALTTTPEGTMLCVYDMRRRMSRDLQEDIDIGLSRSTDGGETWEPVRMIMDMGEYGGLPQEQNGCSDPGIIVDHQTGEIFCFAVWMNGKPGKHQWNDDGSEPGFEIGKSAQFLMVRSQDDGLTWSKPENLTRKLKKESWWLLDEGRGAGYPSLTQVDKQHVAIVYEGSQSHLVFQKFTVAELLAAK